MSRRLGSADFDTMVTQSCGEVKNTGIQISANMEQISFVVVQPSLWTVDALHMGFVRRKYLKKAMTAKRVFYRLLIQFCKLGKTQELPCFLTRCADKATASLLKQMQMSIFFFDGQGNCGAA